MVKYVNMVVANSCNPRVFEGSSLTSIFKLGAKVKLVRERDNPFDTEAIAIYMENLDKVGYVANSTNTVIYGCSSAGSICSILDEDGQLEGIIKFLIGGLPLIEVNATLSNKIF